MLELLLSKFNDIFKNQLISKVLSSRQLINKWTKPNLHEENFLFPFFSQSTVSDSWKRIYLKCIHVVCHNWRLKTMKILVIKLSVELGYVF
jgi:hypothetical protein